MDELDVTAAESKAAYKEVRDYVWEHHLTSKSPVCATWNRHRLGIFSGSVISDAGGSVLTGKAAEGGAAACGGTSHQAGIAAGEVVAAHVTDDVQARDGLEVVVQCVHVVVDLDAVHGADEVAAGLAHTVEGCLLQGGQAVALLAEVLVLPLGSQLIVAIHRCGEGVPLLMRIRMHHTLV